jgi:hypothetical protein
MGERPRSRSIGSFLLVVALLLSIACGALEVRTESTAVPYESPTLAALATQNAHLSTQVALQTTLTAPSPPTSTSIPWPTTTPTATPINAPQPPSRPTASGRLTPTPTLSPNVTPRIASFTGSPSPADPTGAITLSWVVRGASSVTIDWADENTENVARSHLLPSGSLFVPLSDVKFTGGDRVQFRISAYDANGQLLFGEDGKAISEQTIVPLQTDVEIDAFLADPGLVERGGPVTLSWDVSNARSVGITRLSPGGVFLVTEALGLPARGSITLSIPEEYATSVMYYLGARDANGVQSGTYLSVGIICPYEEHLAPECPLTQHHVWAAYEPFEGGHMVWRSDTREIYVLYHDGDYETHEDTWQESEPIEIEGAPPQGLQAPVRGFGKLWANQSGVRERLSWATAAESGYTMAVETIPGGSGRYPGTSTYFTLPDGRVLNLYPFSSTWRLLP